MNLQTLFKIQCGLFVAGVELDGKKNACICNTTMQQSHTPVKISVTLDKSHLTHDMVAKKGSLTICPLSEEVDSAIVKRFGFVSGRDQDKFADFPVEVDLNGNPLLSAQQAAATFSLRVYETVDIGTHSLFLCTVEEMQDYQSPAITYSQYRDRMKK